MSGVGCRHSSPSTSSRLDRLVVRPFVRIAGNQQQSVSSLVASGPKNLTSNSPKGGTAWTKEAAAAEASNNSRRHFVSQNQKSFFRSKRYDLNSVRFNIGRHTTVKCMDASTGKDSIAPTPTIQTEIEKNIFFSFASSRLFFWSSGSSCKKLNRSLLKVYNDARQASSAGFRPPQSACCLSRTNALSVHPSQFYNFYRWHST